MSEEFQCTAPHIKKAAEVEIDNLCEYSKKRYEYAYGKFLIWRQKNKVESLSETDVLAYFNELTSKYAASTLWSQYSMLKATLNLKENVNIGQYNKLIEFLNRLSEQYQPKKSKTLSTEDINKFMREAPDKKYLFTKVVMIIAIGGDCRRDEMRKMKVDDFEDLNSAYVITVPDTKTKSVRKFTVTGTSYKLCKRYMSLRPPHLPERRFFLHYRDGKCTRQVVGINKLGSLPMQIASFLKLPEPKQYTGHYFRKTSTTILKDTFRREKLLGHKQHGDNEIFHSAENSYEMEIGGEFLLGHSQIKMERDIFDDSFQGETHVADVNSSNYVENTNKMDDFCSSISMKWGKMLQGYDSTTRLEIVAKVNNFFKEANDKLKIFTPQNSDASDGSDLILIKTEIKDEIYNQPTQVESNFIDVNFI